MKQGWKIKKLGEVCDILDSQRKPVTKKDRKEGQYPYYGATGIQDYVDSYIFDGNGIDEKTQLFYFQYKVLELHLQMKGKQYLILLPLIP